jgi:hypothetical protein
MSHRLAVNRQNISLTGNSGKGSGETLKDTEKIVADKIKAILRILSKKNDDSGKNQVTSIDENAKQIIHQVHLIKIDERFWFRRTKYVYVYKKK